VLVYDGDRCVGWCQFGSPPELPNINNRRTYDEDAADPPDWRIGCIFTDAKDRGKGVAAAAVATALNEIKRAGGGVIEAYPEQTEQRPPQRGAYGFAAHRHRRDRPGLRPTRTPRSRTWPA
jgi:predicted GNAT family acetyltransferase